MSLATLCFIVIVFFFKQKTAYEMLRSLVGSEMCIRDSDSTIVCAVAFVLGGVIIFATPKMGP